MKKKFLSGLICAAMVAGMLAGCEASEKSTTEAAATGSSQAASTEAAGDTAAGTEGAGEAGGETAANGDLTIGSVIMNTSGEWFAEVIAGQEAAAKDLGVKFRDRKSTRLNSSH